MLKSPYLEREFISKAQWHVGNTVDFTQPVLQGNVKRVSSYLMK